MAVTKEFKIFEKDFKKNYEVIQKFYYKNIIILGKNTLTNILNKSKQELKTEAPTNLLNNTKNEFIGIIQSYFQNLIISQNSLEVYSLTITKKINQSIKIMNNIVNEISAPKVKLEDKESKKKLFFKNKEFKAKYTEEVIYEIIRNELIELCEINGKILE
jgi:hypothetical protein